MYSSYVVSIRLTVIGEKCDIIDVEDRHPCRVPLSFVFVCRTVDHIESCLSRQRVVFICLPASKLPCRPPRRLKPMSFFNRGGGNPPQQPFSGGIPSGPRAGRVPPPDPSRALFERRPVGGGAPAPPQSNYRPGDYEGAPPGGYSSRGGGGNSRLVRNT